MDSCIPRLRWPVCRTLHRNTSARVFGSRSDLRRAAFTADPVFIFNLLQPESDALGIEQGCADTATCIIGTRGYHFREGQGIVSDVFHAVELDEAVY